MKIDTIKHLIHKWKDPFYIRDFFLFKLIQMIYRSNCEFFIFNEKWDNLIILDACRYDSFKSFYLKRNMKGTLKKKISCGSHTTTFLRENFKKEFYDDIVYITANPYVDILLKDRFHAIVSVWKNGWDEKNHTVLPKTMYEYIIDALFRYPDKRLIIHFMQPHYPYIGYKLGKERLMQLREKGFKREKVKMPKKRKNKRLFSLYSLDFYGMISKEDHLKIYNKNLEKAIPIIEKLIDILPGRTVITSDHGESIGDLIHPLIPIQFYGHNANLKLPVLITVPWLVIEPWEKEFKKQEELEEKELLIKKIQNIKNLF
ncbi:MAG: hypothetical protein ACTSRP_12550 [Candidatus Helarchaeota archaeon]